jgi:hypothetical protein
MPAEAIDRVHPRAGFERRVEYGRENCAGDTQ